MLLMRRVVDGFQKLVIARHASVIFRRARIATIQADWVDVDVPTTQLMGTTLDTFLPLVYTASE